METAEIWQGQKKMLDRALYKAKADEKNLRKAINFLRNKEERVQLVHKPKTYDQIQAYIAWGFERRAIQAAKAAAATPKAKAASSSSEALNNALRLATAD